MFYLARALSNGRGALALCALLTLSACPKSDEPPAHPGKRTYLVRCAKCHGQHGDGQGVAMANHGKARSFIRDPFKTASTPGGLPTDDALRAVIRNGLPNAAMPPFPFLSPKELDDLVAFIKLEFFGRRAMYEEAQKAKGP